MRKSLGLIMRGVHKKREFFRSNKNSILLTKRRCKKEGCSRGWVRGSPGWGRRGGMLFPATAIAPPQHPVHSEDKGLRKRKRRVETALGVM